MANDFLPYAFDARANVLSPQLWADDPVRSYGFSAGPARSAKANLLWRQSAFMTAVLARFIAETTGEDVRDNGDVAGFVDQFRRAIGARHEMLLADRDLYVSVDGRDSNPGTQAAPFRSLQAAADYAAFKLDLGAFIVNIRVAPGAYDDGVVVEGVNIANPSQLNFIGDELNPSTCVVAKTRGTGACFQAGNGAGFTVAGFELQNSTVSQDLGGAGIGVWNHGSVFAYNMHLGPCTNAHVYAWNGSAMLGNNIRIVGSAPRVLLASAQANLGIGGGRIVVLGQPTIPVFAEVNGLSFVNIELLSIGGALLNTTQATIDANSVLFTTAMLPGDRPPTYSNGGRYFGPGTAIAIPAPATGEEPYIRPAVLPGLRGPRGAG